MKTMTIRNIPDDVAEGLAARARETGRSMNATAVEALAGTFGKAAGPRKYADFSEFVGTWTDEEYERITKEIEETFEVIDEDEYTQWPRAAEGEADKVVEEWAKRVGENRK